MTRSGVAGSLLFVSLIFIHFRVAVIGGYELTLGLFAAVSFLLCLARRINFATVTMTVALVIVIAASNALIQDVADADEFYRTFGMVIVSVAIVAASASGLWRFDILRSLQVRRALLTALIVIAAVSGLQTVMGTLGSSLFFNPFGDFQYFHRYDPGVGLVTVPRAHGFYLEPSYNAYMVCVIGTALLMLRFRIMFAVTLAGLTLIFTQSVIGFLALAVLACVGLLRARPAVALAVVFGLIGVGVVSWDYILARLATIGADGTSANYRLLAPVPALVDTLSALPAGHPLGSVQSVLAEYQLNMAGISATSLDNGLYVLVFYFGWLGVALIVALLVWAVVACFGPQSSGVPSWAAPVWLCCSLAFSGAVLTPEYACLAALIILTYRAIEAEKNVQTDSVDRRSHVQRPGRVATHH